MTPRLSSSRAPARLVPLLLLAMVLSSALWADDGLSAQQSVVGRVLDGDTGASVEGAMVVLLEGERAHARVLTAADGSFRLSVPLPGRYALRIDRIGYESTLGDAFEVAAGARVERTLQTRVRPVSLAGIEVEGTRRCELRPAEGLATGRVWEEARKALDAAAWTAEKDLYRFGSMLYERELAADGRRVLSEDRRYRSPYAAQPFRSVDADALARDGYIRSGVDESIYYAPDAGVLLSDAFLDTHCFSLERRAEEGERLVGLRFQPVPGRELADIEGVLWMEEAGARLRSVVFRYVDPGQPVPHEEGSGELTFRGLPNGTWIVQEWRIRMPSLVETRDRAGQVQSYAVEGWRDEGGLVTRVTRADGGIVDAGRGMATITGEVRDSLGRPADGARVWIEGAEVEAASDGAFAFSGLLPGTWTVAASHPALEALGFAGTREEVELEAGGSARLVVRLPSLRELAVERCGDLPGEEEVVVLGRVLDERGEPVPGAEVQVLWTTVSSTPTAVRTRRVRGRVTPTLEIRTSAAEEGLGTTADERGAFTLCGVPAAAESRASARTEEMSSPVVNVTPSPGSRVVGLELVLSPTDSGER